MAHSETPVTIDAGSEVTPVAGITQAAGACYAGYDDKALYVAFDADGACNVYRTVGDYTTISTDDSCEFLSEVHAGPWGYTEVPTKPTVGCSIQRIDGDLYVAFSGLRQSTMTAGTYVYRDTSSESDGSGPWVLHGTVQAEALMSAENQNQKNEYGAGGIIVQDERWMIAAPEFVHDSLDSTQAGIYHSDNGGVTWFQDVNAEWWSFGRSNHGWSRSYGKFGDDWYIGGLGNVEAGKNFKSSDLDTWTDIGALGTDNSEGKMWPLSDPGGIFQMEYTVGGSDGVLPLSYLTAAPDGSPAGTVVIADMFPSRVTWLAWGFPAIWNVGPEHAPYWVATHNGKMMGIGTSEPTSPATLVAVGFPETAIQVKKPDGSWVDVVPVMYG